MIQGIEAIIVHLHLSLDARARIRRRLAIAEEEMNLPDERRYARVDSWKDVREFFDRLASNGGL